ncbi:hypothetical protein ACP3BO_001188 [Citrobacter freundii]|uniref:hypothetical protein n=1 Tax=Citrobacter freundii TaxID=546 RepID=UPI002433BCFE|nr:hypothetical protein [Citrobacter freundii]WFV11117.1 hypothetical protein NFJ20_10565 [Citrobacter freundii]
MDASAIAEDLMAYPVMHFIGGNQSGVGLPVIRANEINWWKWPALVFVHHELILFYIRQKCRKHSVEQIAVGFVCRSSVDCHTNIIAAVKRCMSAFVNKGTNAVIENTNQINVFTCYIIEKMAARAVEHAYVSQGDAKRFFCLLPFLF